MKNQLDTMTLQELKDNPKNTHYLCVIENKNDMNFCCGSPGRKGYRCTRPHNHMGYHIACGTSEVCDVWEKQQ